MTANELRQKYLDFFKQKGHTIIPSASLIPENDPTVLFTTAGMHPLVPYLMGEDHPGGKRVTNSQKCIRTVDIEEVGDTTHHTFFEMLGNWSFGDPAAPDGVGVGYFKKETIEMSWEFLTSPKWLGLDKNRIAVSVFAGDEDAPFDEEAFTIWKNLGVAEKKIAKLPKKQNWWGPAGEIGPCGPDTEMFYWVGDPDKVPGSFNDDNDLWVEIWNDVFMQYNKKEDGVYESLAQKNVDTGMGLERVLAVINELDDNYQTELFSNLIFKVEQLSGKKYSFKTKTGKYIKGYSIKSFDPHVEVSNTGETGYVNHDKEIRIIADHIKAATFIMGDDKGVAPSNTDQGYVARRLIRRAIRYGKQIGITENLWTKEVGEIVVNDYLEIYPELKNNINFIINNLKEEEVKFAKTLDKGERKFNEIEDDIKKIMHLSKSPFKKDLSLIEFRDAIERYLVVKPFKKLLDYYDRNLKDKISPLIPLEKKDFDIIEDKKTSEFIKKEAENILNNIIINGKTVFDLYQSYGFPIEITKEIAEEKGFKIDENGFNKELAKHQELSRTASAGKFKGGLADAGEETKRLHTAAHLLLASLRKVLGDHVYQKGSNITAERLRFDFSHPEKLTDEQKQAVENLVNQAIKDDLSVSFEEMALDEAKAKGAMGVFESRYGEKVKVYRVGNGENIFSYEICGGPHVEKTGELGEFKIKKEQSSSAGVRRIKAVL